MKSREQDGYVVLYVTRKKCDDCDVKKYLKSKKKAQ